ncbi:MAG: hypothetical protein HY301_10335 [Verrucomicrobia bacterium]|nr:hypothetical protein [Verrucomicrobiota bacterium]
MSRTSRTQAHDRQNTLDRLRSRIITLFVTALVLNQPAAFTQTTDEWVNTAESKFQRGQLTQAIAGYVRAIESSPTNAALKHRLAWIRQQQYLRQETSNTPDSLRAYTNWTYLRDRDPTGPKEKFEPAAQHDLDLDGRQSKATLFADNPTNKLGTGLHLTIHFASESGGSYFNPQLHDGYLFTPGVVAMFDGSGRYLGNLNDSYARESIFGIGPDTWVKLKPGGSFNREFRFTSGRIVGTKYGGGPETWLPPGKYFIQAIYFEGLIQTYDEIISKGAIKTNELFRSNSLEVEFVK